MKNCGLFSILTVCTYTSAVLQLWRWQNAALHLRHCIAHTYSERLQKWIGIEVCLVNLKRNKKGKM